MHFIYLNHARAKQKRKKHTQTKDDKKNSNKGERITRKNDYKKQMNDMDIQM